MPCAGPEPAGGVGVTGGGVGETGAAGAGVRNCVGAGDGTGTEEGAVEIG